VGKTEGQQFFKIMESLGKINEEDKQFFIDENP